MTGNKIIRKKRNKNVKIELFDFFNPVMKNMLQLKAMVCKVNLKNKLIQVQLIVNWLEGE